MFLQGRGGTGAPAWPRAAQELRIFAGGEAGAQQALHLPGEVRAGARDPRGQLGPMQAGNSLEWRGQGLVGFLWTSLTLSGDPFPGFWMGHWPPHQQLPVHIQCHAGVRQASLASSAVAWLQGSGWPLCVPQACAPGLCDFLRGSVLPCPAPAAAAGAWSQNRPGPSCLGVWRCFVCHRHPPHQPLVGYGMRGESR